jgi:beta-mannanase
MGPAEYKKIIAGDRDASIKDAAAAAKAYGKRFFFSPMHEPENDQKTAPYGDEDYAKAYRHVIDVMRANGANNIVTVWNVMGAEKWMGRYDTLYPGDNYVDWIASDPYSHNAKDTLTSYHSVKMFYDWGAKKKKPMMWAEWGYDSANVSTASNFFSQAGLDKLQSEMPLLKALIYWSEWEYDLVNFPSQWKAFSNFDEFNWTVPTSVAK